MRHTSNRRLRYDFRLPFPGILDTGLYRQTPLIIYDRVQIINTTRAYGKGERYYSTVCLFREKCRYRIFVGYTWHNNNEKKLLFLLCGIGRRKRETYAQQAGALFSRSTRICTTNVAARRGFDISAVFKTVNSSPTARAFDDPLPQKKKA